MDAWYKCTTIGGAEYLEARKWLGITPIYKPFFMEGGPTPRSLGDNKILTNHGPINQVQVLRWSSKYGE